MLTPNERCQGGRFFRVILETGVDQIVQLSGFGEHYCHSTLSTDTATTDSPAMAGGGRPAPISSGSGETNRYAAWRAYDGNRNALHDACRRHDLLRAFGERLLERRLGVGDVHHRHAPRRLRRVRLTDTAAALIRVREQMVVPLGEGTLALNVQPSTAMHQAFVA